MRDKRYFKRFEKKLEIEFAPNGTFHTDTTDDLSLNGLFIRTEHKFDLYTILTIVIHLSDGKTSRLKGKVMRATEDGIGVQLMEKDSAYLHYYTNCLLNAETDNRGGGS